MRVNHSLALATSLQQLQSGTGYFIAAAAVWHWLLHCSSCSLALATSLQQLQSGTGYFIAAAAVWHWLLCAAAAVDTHLGEECDAVQVIVEYWVMEGYHVREYSQVL